MENNNQNSGKIQYMPISMCIGMSVGMAIGSAVGNIAIGMCIGLSIGLCVGSMIDFKHNKNANDASCTDEKETESDD